MIRTVMRTSAALPSAMPAMAPGDNDDPLLSGSVVGDNSVVGESLGGDVGGGVVVLEDVVARMSSSLMASSKSRRYTPLAFS